MNYFLKLTSDWDIDIIFFMFSFPFPFLTLLFQALWISCAPNCISIFYYGALWGDRQCWVKQWYQVCLAKSSCPMFLQKGLHVDKLLYLKWTNMVCSLKTILVHCFPFPLLFVAMIVVMFPFFLHFLEFLSGGCRVLLSDKACLFLWHI